MLGIRRGFVGNEVLVISWFLVSFYVGLVDSIPVLSSYTRQTLSTFDFTVENQPQNLAGVDICISRAKSVLESRWESPIPVNVLLQFTNENILGFGLFTSSYKVNDVMYPVAAAEAISGQNLNDVSSPDVVVTLGIQNNWHADPNSPPNTQASVDLLTVILHEVVHGLFMSGWIDIVDDEAIFDSGRDLFEPLAFDYFLGSKSKECLITGVYGLNPDYSVPNREAALAYTDPGDVVFMYLSQDGTKIQTQPLYSSANYERYESLYHSPLHRSGQNTPAQLMVPEIPARFYAHDLDPSLLEIQNAILRGPAAIPNRACPPRTFDADAPLPPQNVEESEPMIGSVTQQTFIIIVSSILGVVLAISIVGIVIWMRSEHHKLRAERRFIRKQQAEERKRLKLIAWQLRKESADQRNRGRKRFSRRKHIDREALSRPSPGPNGTYYGAASATNSQQNSLTRENSASRNASLGRSGRASKQNSIPRGNSPKPGSSPRAASAPTKQASLPRVHRAQTKPVRTRTRSRPTPSNRSRLQSGRLPKSS